MITEIWFPEPAKRAVLTEFAPRQGDFAVVAAAVSADIDGRRVPQRTRGARRRRPVARRGERGPAERPAGHQRDLAGHGRARRRPDRPPRRRARRRRVPAQADRHPGVPRARRGEPARGTRFKRDRLDRRRAAPQGRPPDAAGPGPVRRRPHPPGVAARGVRPQPARPRPGQQDRRHRRQPGPGGGAPLHRGEPRAPLPAGDAGTGRVRSHRDAHPGGRQGQVRRRAGGGGDRRRRLPGGGRGRAGRGGLGSAARRGEHGNRHRRRGAQAA